MIFLKAPLSAQSLGWSAKRFCWLFILTYGEIERGAFQLRGNLERENCARAVLVDCRAGSTTVYSTEIRFDLLDLSADSSNDATFRDVDSPYRDAKFVGGLLRA